MPAAATPDLWALVQGQTYIDAAALAEAIVVQVKSGDLDYRTRLLIRDSLKTLAVRWPKVTLDRWLADCGEETVLRQLWTETHVSEGFPSLAARTMNVVTAEQIKQVFRLIGCRLRQRTEVCVGGAASLILRGLIARATEDIDLVDEVPAAIRNDHSLVNEIQQKLDLHLAHFQQHYLPTGWKERVESLEPFDNLRVYLVDPTDVFLGKLTSRREKDFGDLRLLARKLDKSAVVERLRNSMAATFASEKLKGQAAENWYILFGEPLPS